MSQTDTDALPMISLETDDSQSAEFYVVKGFNVGRWDILLLKYTGGSREKGPVSGTSKQTGRRLSRWERWLITLSSSPTKMGLTKISTYLVVWCFVALAIMLCITAWYFANDVAPAIIMWGVIAAVLAGLSCIRKL